MAADDFMYQCTSVPDYIELCNLAEIKKKKKERIQYSTSKYNNNNYTIKNVHAYHRNEAKTKTAEKPTNTANSNCSGEFISSHRKSRMNSCVHNVQQLKFNV